MTAELSCFKTEKSYACKPKTFSKKKTFVTLAKWIDKNQAIDNRIIHSWLASENRRHACFKYPKHSFIFDIYGTTFFFKEHASKASIIY